MYSALCTADVLPHQLLTEGTLIKFEEKTQTQTPILSIVHYIPCISSRSSISGSNYNNKWAIVMSVRGLSSN